MSGLESEYHSFGRIEKYTNSVDSLFQLKVCLKTSSVRKMVLIE